MLLNKKRAIEMMDRYEVDALIATSPENITYISDFPRMHRCLTDSEIYAILPREQNITPVIVISLNAVDLFLASNSWINDIELWGEFYICESDKINYDVFTPLEERYTQIVRTQKAKPSALEALAKALKERGLIDGRLGFDEKGLTPAQYEKIKSLFSQAKILSGDHIFNRIRMVKTNEEIRRLKKVTQITEEGIQALLDVLGEGKTEKEVAEVYKQTVRERGVVPYYECIQGGTRGALVNGAPTSYTFKTGDGVRLDLNCIYDSYYSDVARVAVIGKPSKKLEIYHQAMLVGIQRVENEVIKPGIRASEVFKALVKVIRDNGIPHFKRNNTGHGLGLSCCEFPIISTNNDIPLEVGTVFALETPYYEIGFGCVQIEDTVIVTESGCQRLQTSDLQLKLV